LFIKKTPQKLLVSPYQRLPVTSIPIFPYHAYIDSLCRNRNFVAESVFGFKRVFKKFYVIRFFKRSKDEDLRRSVARKVEALDIASPLFSNLDMLLIFYQTNYASTLKARQPKFFP